MTRVTNQYFKDMLRAILKQRADQGLPMTAEFLGSVWSSLIGEELGRVTRPVALDGRRLTIATPTESWRQIMHEQVARLRENLNHLLPTPLDHIQIVLAAPGLFDAQLEPTVRRPPVLGSLPMADAQLIEDIDDPELRRILKRVRRLDRGNKR